MKPYFILDPGHGPNQSGKRSPYLEDGRQFLEWESNWKVAELLLEMIKNNNDMDACLSLQIPKEKVGRMLEERVKFINSVSEGVKKHNFIPICISIHSNAFSNTWSPPSGIETYYYKHPRQSNETRNIGRAYALHLQKEIVKILEFKDRGVRPNHVFYMLKNTTCTTVLTETGFYTNRKEVEKMLSPDFAELSATGHYNGLIEITKTINS